ncbi:MAG TPA: hypothetical protein VHN55_11080 [Sphingomicrobium sp.]|nr:hypothetical protein [Sphingomicrobium sp.]
MLVGRAIQRAPKYLHGLARTSLLPHEVAKPRERDSVAGVLQEVSPQGPLLGRWITLR